MVHPPDPRCPIASFGSIPPDAANPNPVGTPGGVSGIWPISATVLGSYIAGKPAARRRKIDQPVTAITAAEGAVCENLCVDGRVSPEKTGETDHERATDKRNSRTD